MRINYACARPELLFLPCPSLRQHPFKPGVIECTAERHSRGGLGRRERPRAGQPPPICLPLHAESRRAPSELERRGTRGKEEKMAKTRCQSWCQCTCIGYIQIQCIVETWRYDGTISVVERRVDARLILGCCGFVLQSCCCLQASSLWYGW